jgi:chitodextrinase
MAFSNLASNQMVSYAEASTGGFNLKSGQTNSGTQSGALKMITKDVAFAMYNLSATTGSNGITGSQLMKKSYWLGLTSSIMPQYIGSGVLFQDRSTSNIYYPSNLVQGDLIVMHILSVGGTAITTPSGWTRNLRGSDTGYSECSIFSIISTGSESGFIVVGTNGRTAGLMYNVRNTNGLMSVFLIKNNFSQIRLPGDFTLSDANTLAVDLFLFEGANNSTAYSFQSGWISKDLKSVGLGSAGVTSFSTVKELPVANTAPGYASIDMVTAYNSFGFTLYISGASASASPTDTTAPTAPTNLAASNITARTLTLNWSASTDNVGVTNYLVHINGALVATLGNVLTYNVTGLSPNTNYSFIVYARDSAGNVSTKSNTVLASTLTETPAPNTPTGLVATNFSNSEITISWNSSTGATGYVLYRSNTSSGSYNTLVDTTSTSYFDSGLATSTTYWYKVSAYNNTGQSALSAAVSATTRSSGTV